MTMTIDKLKNTDLELIEMLFSSFHTDDKIADVISKFAAKYQKTEGSVKMRWNRIRPLYVEIARERGLTDIVKDAEHKTEVANKIAEARKKNKLESSVPAVAKKTSIKKQELFDRFNKTDYMLDKLEQMQKETLQHIQIYHKSNDARFNGVSSMLKLIAENVDNTKQISHQANGLVTVNKFGQVQTIGMNETTHLDEDKVLALIDAHEKLEDELKNERDLRMTGEDLYDELKIEFNKLQDELVSAKKEIGLTKQVRRNLELSNVQIQNELNASIVEIDKLIKENTKLANMNKLLNKRGLFDRLLNRDVEYNTVTN